LREVAAKLEEFSQMSFKQVSERLEELEAKSRQSRINATANQPQHFLKPPHLDFPSEVVETTPGN
jgi:hypothetical protein